MAPRPFTAEDRLPLQGTVPVQTQGGRTNDVDVTGFRLDETRTSSRQCRKWFYTDGAQTLQWFRTKPGVDGKCIITWTLVSNAPGAQRRPRPAPDGLKKIEKKKRALALNRVAIRRPKFAQSTA